MKYAVISDIHGNLPALQAVLKDAGNIGVDKYIFAGDYYMCSPFPNEVAETIRNIKNAYVIKGNEESYLSDLAKKDQSTWTDGQFCTLYWCYRTITEENRMFLTSLPKNMDVSEDNVNIFIAHSPEEFIGNSILKKFSSARISENYRKDFSRDRLLRDMQEYSVNDADVIEKANSLKDGIYISGHLHIQWNFRLENRLFVSPGSCGLPLDGVAGAPYSVLEVTGNDMKVHERRVEYDTEALICALKKSELYKEARIWSDIIIKELNTGFEHIHFFLRFAEEYANGINDEKRPFSKETWAGAYEKWNTGHFIV